jgi:hypothetical protein
LQLDPAPGTQLNLADCYARLGRTASAWANFIEVAEKDVKTARAAEARRRAKALEPRLSRLTVVAESADWLRVTRDGEEITALLGVSVPVDPGMHVVAARHGGEEWSTEVAIQGDAQTASVTVPRFWKDAVETAKRPEPPAEPRPVPPVPAPAPEPPTAAPAPGRDRTWAWIVGGVGVAAVTTGLIFGGIAKSRWDSSRDLGCHDNAAGDYVCPPPPNDGFNKATSAKGAATVSTIFVVAGGAALVGGGVLWFIAPEKERSVSIVPAAAPGEVGVVVRGRF